jgi:ABC-type cobalamin/Fe3+-siderophores transport system ATPase subunit
MRWLSRTSAATVNPTSIPLSEFTSIIGRNDDGKSTLLKALEDLFQWRQ